jgi:hypothetical protein
VASAEERIGTLTLDGLSYVSFGDAQNLAIPAGSFLRFRFADPGADGSVAIAIAPGDASIAPIAVGDDATLRYRLASPATGTIRRVGGRAEIELQATLTASLEESGAEGATTTYELRFTTGTASAVDASRTETVTVEGTPVEGVGYVQLVGAATNLPDAFPGPGEAVYAVLSGRFDWLPALP